MEDMQIRIALMVIYLSAIAFIFFRYVRPGLIRNKDLYTNNFRIARRRNSDTEARRQYQRLATKAQSSLKFYDDGGENSIYDEADFADALVDIFLSKPKLKVELLFNCPYETAFIQKVKQQHSQGNLVNVGVKLHDPSVAMAKNLHFKIVDGGERIRLSKHSLESDYREFESWRCLDITKLLPNLKVYLDRFDKAYERASWLSSADVEYC